MIKKWIQTWLGIETPKSPPQKKKYARVKVTRAMKKDIRALRDQNHTYEEIAQLMGVTPYVIQKTLKGYWPKGSKKAPSKVNRPPNGDTKKMGGYTYRAMRTRGATYNARVWCGGGTYHVGNFKTIEAAEAACENFIRYECRNYTKITKLNTPKEALERA